MVMSGISTYIFTQVINCTIHKIKQIYRASVLSGSIAVIFLHVMSPFLMFILTLVQSDLEFLRTYLSLHKSVHANTVHVLHLNIPSICISMAYTDNVRDLAPTFHFQLMQLLNDEVLILYAPKLH